MLAESLESLEQGGVGLAAIDVRLVVESRLVADQGLGGENGLAIEIVLRLLARLVAHPHGSHSPVAGKTRREMLGGDLAAVEIVDGNQATAGTISDTKQKI